MQICGAPLTLGTLGFISIKIIAIGKLEHSVESRGFSFRSEKMSRQNPEPGLAELVEWKLSDIFYSEGAELHYFVLITGRQRKVTRLLGFVHVKRAGG